MSKIQHSPVKEFLARHQLVIILVAALAFLVAFVILAQPEDSGAADTAPTFSNTSSAIGWAPSSVINVGAFGFNGSYNVLAAGFSLGTAYTWKSKGNLDSIGLYLGPQAAQAAGGSAVGSLSALLYLDLYKTSLGPVGIGIGTRFWQTGRGIYAPNRNDAFLALGFKL